MAGSAADPAPAVSVLVVTHRRSDELRRCLDALSREREVSGVPCEVLTVHSPGDDDSMAMVQERFPWVRVLQSDRRHMTAQRNQGVRAAKAPLLAFLDDDAWPQPGWLQALVDAFTDAGLQGLGGHVFFADGRRQYGPMVVTALGRPFPIADGGAMPARLSPTLPGCNMAFRADALRAIGGFDERLVYHFDDVDVSRRLWLANGRRPGALRHVESVRAFHEPARGPFRRTPLDRAWYVVARDSIYFAFRHAGRANPLAWLGAGLLQGPKVLRIFGWLARGRLGPVAFARCLGKQLAGMVAGYMKGVAMGPILPLGPQQGATT